MTADRRFWVWCIPIAAIALLLVGIPLSAAGILTLFRGVLFSVLFMIVPVVLVVWLVFDRLGTTTRRSREDVATQLAKVADLHARGALSDDEFAASKALIISNDAPARRNL